MNYGICRDQISLKLTKSFNKNFFLWAFLNNEFRARGMSLNIPLLMESETVLCCEAFLLETLEFF